MRTVTYAQAIQEATAQTMRADDRVLVYGLDVSDHKGIYGTTLGLEAEFGSSRVFSTSLSEDAMTGVGIGMALAGLRPIHVHIRMDFVLLCMNQLINMAAKLREMSGGQVTVPLVVRAIIGRSWGQGGQHSQGLYPLLMHIPGWKVCAPTTPYDAKGCLMAAIHDDGPVLIVEHRLLYATTGHVPEDRYQTPFGRARVLCEGDDIALVGVSDMVNECQRAAHLLAQVGCAATVIDPISLWPLDLETIAGAGFHTGHAVVVDHTWVPCGAGAEIVARLSDTAAERGVLPVRTARLGYLHQTCPTAKHLERTFYPTPHTIAEAALRLRYGAQSAGRIAQVHVLPTPDPPEPFKGPF